MPNYGAPPAEENTEMLRVVGGCTKDYITSNTSVLTGATVRETLSADLIERLISDILETTESLMGTLPNLPHIFNSSSYREHLKIGCSSNQNHLVNLTSTSATCNSFNNSYVKLNSTCFFYHFVICFIMGSNSRTASSFSSFESANLSIPFICYCETKY